MTLARSGASLTLIVGGVVLWALLQGLAFFSPEPYSPVYKTFRTASLAVSAVLLLALVKLVRRWRSLNRPVQARGASGFVGPPPISEGSLFLGREADIDQLLRQVLDPENRMVTLTGASGTGKTSLIQAGLIPRLRGHACMPIHLRLFPDPERRLREALRPAWEAVSSEADRPRILDADGLPITSSAPPRLEDLPGKLAGGSQGPVILFLDQFEEWFLASDLEDADQRRSVRDFFKACLSAPTRTIVLVFSIRLDLFEMMRAFDEMVDEPFREANRYLLKPFTRATAHRVIAGHLPADGDDIAWDSALVNAVLDDLVKSRRSSGGSREESILPAELQVVCHMLQAKRCTTVEQYPGRRELTREYVRNAVGLTAVRERTLRTLFLLVDDSGTRRARPRTVSEIAALNDALDERAVRETLAELQDDYRLVLQLAGAGDDPARSEPLYELTHEYLVPIVRELSGHAFDRAYQARLMLEEWRRSETGPGNRAPALRDSKWMLQYVHADLRPEELITLRRQLRRRRVLIGGAAGLVAATIVGSWTCLARVSLEYRKGWGQQVVVRRGLPYLTPLLGSRAVMVDTGINAALISKEGFSACGDERLFLHIPGLHDDAVANELLRWLGDGLARSAGQSDTPWLGELEALMYIDFDPVRQRALDVIAGSADEANDLGVAAAQAIVETDDDDLQGTLGVMRASGSRRISAAVCASLIETHPSLPKIAETVEWAAQSEDPGLRALGLSYRVTLAIDPEDALERLWLLSDEHPSDAFVRSMSRDALEAIVQQRALTTEEWDRARPFSSRLDLVSQAADLHGLPDFVAESLVERLVSVIENNSFYFSPVSEILDVLPDHYGADLPRILAEKFGGDQERDAAVRLAAISIAEDEPWGGNQTAMRSFLQSGLLTPPVLESPLPDVPPGMSPEDWFMGAARLGLSSRSARDEFLEQLSSSLWSPENLATYGLFLRLANLSQDEALALLDSATDDRLRLAVAFGIDPVVDRSLELVLESIDHPHWDDVEILWLMEALTIRHPRATAWLRDLLWYSSRPSVLADTFLLLAQTRSIDAQSWQRLLEALSDPHSDWRNTRIVEALSLEFLNSALESGSPATTLVERLRSPEAARSALWREGLFEALALATSGRSPEEVEAMLQPLLAGPWPHQRLSLREYRRAAERVALKPGPRLLEIMGRLRGP
jgi:hypothetical protein